MKGDDGKAAMGAVARAVETEVLAKTTVNLRGVPAETARGELEDAGVTAEDATEVLAILRACEDARFSPDGVQTTTARETWERARTVLDHLQSAGSKPA